MEAHAPKPSLSLPAAEYRWFGLASIAGGVIFEIAAVSIERPMRAFFLFALFGLFFGLFFYVLVTRKMVRRAAAGASTLVDADLEDAKTMQRRVAKVVGVQLIGMVGIAFLCAVQQAPGIPFAAGALCGGGGGMLAASRWVTRWETEHGARLLRTPVYRWGHVRETGGWGRGVVDPRDFFVLRDPKD